MTKRKTNTTIPIKDTEIRVNIIEKFDEETQKYIIPTMKIKRNAGHIWHRGVK